MSRLLDSLAQQAADAKTLAEVRVIIQHAFQAGQASNPPQESVVTAETVQVNDIIIEDDRTRWLVTSVDRSQEGRGEQVIIEGEVLSSNYAALGAPAVVKTFPFNTVRIVKRDPA